MRLSKQLWDLIQKIGTTREGVWGLGWQIAKLVQQKLPIDLQKSPLRVYDDQIRQFFSSEEEAKTNINIVDVYIGERIEKQGTYEEYSIIVQFKLNEEDYLEQVEDLINDIRNLTTQYGLTYQRDILLPDQAEYDYQFSAYKWLPTGTMKTIGE